MKLSKVLKYLVENEIVHEVLSTGIKVGSGEVFEWRTSGPEFPGEVFLNGHQLHRLVEAVGKPIFETSVFIGRFQPIHLEHLRTIRLGLKASKKVIVVIGSAFRPRDPKNPWTHEEREWMIRASFTVEENKRLHFLPVMDLYYNLPLWFTQVQEGVADLACAGEVALLGYEKDSSSFYLKGFPQWDYVPYHSDIHTNATDIREALFKPEGLEAQALDLLPLDGGTKTYLYQWSLNYPNILKDLVKEFNFLKEYKKKWELAPYQPTFVTADAVVIKSGHILLVRRRCNPGKGLLALPGGYLEAREDFVEAAVRELREETDIAVSNEILLSSVRCVRPFAHPDRDPRGRTITHASLIDLGFGSLPSVKGKDDALEALWIPLSEIHSLTGEFFSDHYAIVTNLIHSF